MPTGGAITLNGKNIIINKKILNSKRWCGISNRHGSYYDVDTLGWNYYINEFSAAIGLEQLKKLDKLNNRRKSIAKKYHKKINLEHKMSFDSNCSYHFYWILVKKRKQFMNKMFDSGIETGIHYNPIHKMSFYRTSKTLPNTENISNMIVSIPTHPNLTDSDVDTIIELTNKII